MRNKYKGYCADCRAPVGVGEGYFELRSKRFVVRCMTCVTTGKIAKGKALSYDQQHYAAAALKENTNE